MNTLLSARPSPALLDFGATPFFGAGRGLAAIDAHVEALKKLTSGAVANLANMRDVSVKEIGEPDQLQAKLASLKQVVTTIAMHLDTKWRRSLLSTIERLLDRENWDPESELPSEQSFSTFLRMIIYLCPTRRPSVGLSPKGHFLAAWSVGSDRIVVECAAKDEVRWVLSRANDGIRESGAGKGLLHRLPDVIAPYEPEKLLQNGDKILA
jgi:hypothetical protein